METKIFSPYQTVPVLRSAFDEGGRPISSHLDPTRPKHLSSVKSVAPDSFDLIVVTASEKEVPPSPSRPSEAKRTSSTINHKPINHQPSPRVSPGPCRV